MPAEVAIHQLTPGIAVWQRYDPSVKADLFSTLIETTSGLYIVDPVPVPGGPPDLPECIAGVIVTNSNHPRAAVEFAEKLAVPIYAHPDAAAQLPGPVERVTGGTSTVPGLETIPIAGAPLGEIALYCPAEGGTLVLGDALINMEALGFTYLPAKYCSNQRLMRKSLRALLAYDFQRILFAHGTPIVSRAQPRLAELLDERPARKSE